MDSWLAKAEAGELRISEVATIEGLNGTRNLLMWELHEAEQVLARSLRHRLKTSEREHATGLGRDRAA
jgi:hypothetical protein